MKNKEGWKVDFLDEICEVNYGTRVVNSQVTGGEYFVYGGGGATFTIDKFNRENCLVIARFAMSKQCVRFVKGKFFLNDSGLSLTIKKPEGLKDSFLNYQMFWLNDTIYNSAKGAAQKNLDVPSFRKLKLVIPPLPNQHQIVSELDTLSEIISKKKQQLEELDKLAQATFYEMFGDPVSNEKGWEIGCLKNYTTKIGSGSTPTGGNQSYKSEGISLIRSMNVLNGSFKYKDLAYIDDIQAKQLDNVTIQKDDVLINITGASVARSCIVPENILPARVNQHVSIIRLKVDLNCVYVNSLFISPYFQLKLIELGKANGATREAITKSQLEILEIPIPPLSMQNQFATKIESIENQKTLINQSIGDVQQLFDYTMDNYFN